MKVVGLKTMSRVQARIKKLKRVEQMLKTNRESQEPRKVTSISRKKS